MSMLFPLRAFLPEQDPLAAFAHDSPLSQLDQWGRDLPSWLVDPGFRAFARGLKIPRWAKEPVSAEDLPALRLYYLRLGFLASGYINQIGQPKETLLPANLAQPLAHACRLLGRMAILSYDGYALFNWRRFDPQGAVALGNIDTLQNFVHLYDEHWFILVHVEIEALAVRMTQALDRLLSGAPRQNWNEALLNQTLVTLTQALNDQIKVLKRIPEQMDPMLYFCRFRPYIRFFDDVVYEGVSDRPINFRGETGAQSSIIPLLEAFLKIPHQESELTRHLRDMRKYMPLGHHHLLGVVETWPPVKPLADPGLFDALLDTIADFRSVHLGWAEEYINRQTDDPRGTGGTPYMFWLKQLIEETRSFKHRD